MKPENKMEILEALLAAGLAAMNALMATRRLSDLTAHTAPKEQRT